MSIPKFDPKELTVVDELPSQWGAPTPVYRFPVSLREGFAALYHKKPLWQITGLEQVIFSPKVNPDNIARAFVFDGSDIPFGTGGGRDMFGIDWEFVPQVGGSMVRPGKPFLEDANEWADKLVWPDVNAWEWEQAAADNAKYLSDGKYNVCWFLNGWYERLISFMDFEGAIMAMIDEDQQHAVKALFDKLTDLYIKI
ncbi:MAG: methyltransferase, partial [Oscillospiraceae bacterium]|nr:methyltransferase [Oscillospiraceae bacterium]